MRFAVLRPILGIILNGILTAVPATLLWAQPTYQGPEKCQMCHKAEISVWEDTTHAKSLKTMHKTEEAKAIIKAIGGKRIKRDDTCTMCHYTMVESKGKLKSVAGPSCESCHGASSEWLAIHNQYGEGAKRETESAEHKALRIESATVAGMIWPPQTFDVATNCFSCHGMANESLSGETIATMLEAGHPINPEFELVRYSQGSVRHRFYPPDLTKNSEMAPDELARFFIAGHAASLVAAARALSKTDHPKYVAAQQARISAADAALEAIQDEVPEASALLNDPNDANARALVRAIKGKDLSGSVGDLLPASATYK